jgi:CheY-like chemotaxis protein
MPDGGELEITSSLAELDEHYTQLTEGRGKFMVVAVRDTGTGIDPQVIDKIFDPFFTTKEQGKGTGLGLSTSLGIVRSHGGFISVYSEPGNGTVFNVYLPLIESDKASATHDAPSAPPPGNGELIMLVDDEEPIRRTTRRMLEASNYRVITAADGHEACSLYREHSRDISLVLTDMMMPVMDGAAMIRELKSSDPTLPIIATSGLAEAGREEQARDVGARRFMAKPYTASSLLWAVHELLNKGTNGTDHKES